MTEGGKGKGRGVDGLEKTWRRRWRRYTRMGGGDKITIGFILMEMCNNIQAIIVKKMRRRKYITSNIVSFRVSMQN